MLGGFGPSPVLFALFLILAVIFLPEGFGGALGTWFTRLRARSAKS
jgi:hypothetical protein